MKLFVQCNNKEEIKKNQKFQNDFTFFEPKNFISPEKAALNSSNDSICSNFLKNISSDKKKNSPIVYDMLQKKLNFEIKEFSFSS